MRVILMIMELIFLSTLSVRRATVERLYLTDSKCISIHALREESDQKTERKQCLHSISIHALLTGSDNKSANNKLFNAHFYLRIQLILDGGIFFRRTEISIHALRKESDNKSAKLDQ